MPSRWTLLLRSVGPSTITLSILCKRNERAGRGALPAIDVEWKIPPLTLQEQYRESPSHLIVTNCQHHARSWVTAAWLLLLPLYLHCHSICTAPSGHHCMPWPMLSSLAAAKPYRLLAPAGAAARGAKRLLAGSLRTPQPVECPLTRLGRRPQHCTRRYLQIRAENAVGCAQAPVGSCWQATPAATAADAQMLLAPGHARCIAPTRRAHQVPSATS